MLEYGLSPDSMILDTMVSIPTNRYQYVSMVDSNNSPIFEATNGVNQGGVLSPILFAVYVDGLCHRLNKSGVGCQMGNYFTGCLLYAEYANIICPAIKGLKKMVAICEEYAIEFNVKCNEKKGKCLICNDKMYKIGIKIIEVNGDTINSCEMADHLVHRISVSDKDSMKSGAITSFWKTFILS